MTKLNFKKPKVFISIILITLILITACVYIPTLNVDDKTFDQRFKFTGKEIKKPVDYSKIYIADDLSYSKKMNDYAYNFINPIQKSYYVVYNSEVVLDTYVVQVALVKTSRSNIFSLDWKIDDVITARTENYTFKEVINLVQNNNIFENNPDPKNISVYGSYPFDDTPKELSESKKFEQMYNNASPTEKIQILEKEKKISTDNKQSFIEAYGEIEGLQKYNEYILYVEQMISEIKDKNNLR